MAEKKVLGDYKAQYGSLRDYIEELVRSNPGPFPRQILTAVGMDGNNGIYPLAYSLVEAETTDNWTWFLECLGDDLDLHSNSNFTFISDRQKGIIPALQKVFPSAEHRYCLIHIHENMKPRWRGVVFKNMLQKCAFATTPQEFERSMKEIQDKDTSLYDWLKEIPPKHWSRAYFSEKWVDEACIYDMAMKGIGDSIPEKWVDEAYYLETWKKVYSKTLDPINSMDLWPMSKCPTTLTAPKYHKQIGRPKKYKKKSAEELSQKLSKGGKLTREGGSVKCDNCKQIGHNKRSYGKSKGEAAKSKGKGKRDQAGKSKGKRKVAKSKGKKVGMLEHKLTRHQNGLE
ncbi:uncharacterized protein LOC143566337 [Bidens hawaiensis]|uniref:uncharacterized protein LOC143566337 n=1 Tax=Bidens hawaiensis TaxID=980011 RepID=UPI00404B6A47